mgnify:CR=1 FL=1
MCIHVAYKNKVDNDYMDIDEGEAFFCEVFLSTVFCESLFVKTS